MSESFVDLTYRGLALGRRIRLSQVRPSTGYLELPQPMPVGTRIAILTDDTVALEATVVELHEQVGGSDRVPGMLVRPTLEAEAAKGWWGARVTLPELEKKPAPPAVPAPLPAAKVVQKRTSRDTQMTAVPEIVAEPQDTAVMEAVDPDQLVRPSSPNLQDDGKQTQMMDAVDLAALGLTSPSGQMPAVTPPEDEDDKPSNNSGVKKRKKKR